MKSDPQILPDSQVSILIPAYNAKKYINEAIESALAQSHKNTEVIVFDDGSTDNTLDIVKSYEGLQNFFWASGPNQGGCVARNTLLEMAKGEFIQFLDADDQLSPTKVEIQLRILTNDIDVDAVICDYSEFTELGGDERRVHLPSIHNSPDILSYFLRNSVITMLPLHRRCHLVAVGGFDETLNSAQEFDLHLRLAHKRWKKVSQINRCLAIRRNVSTSVSSNELAVYGNVAESLVRLYSQLSAEGRWSSELADNTAIVLHNAGRHLVRNGDLKSARKAFTLAKSMSKSKDLGLSRLMAIATIIFGPIRAERLRMTIR